MVVVRRWWWWSGGHFSVSIYLEKFNKNENKAYFTMFLFVTYENDNDKTVIILA